MEVSVRGVPIAALPLARRWAARWLSFPRATWAALALGALLSAPTLSLGLLLDDYFQLYAASILGSPWQALDLFNLIPGDPATVEALIRGGPLPWWTHPGLKLAFWRPLASVLIRLDVAAFGQSVWLYHLHSAVWYLAVIGACALLLRRALPGALGAGALLLFALDGVHWMPVTWLANRNALVAAAPALLGLVAHVRWREERWRPGLPLSLLGFAVGLAGGEAALGVFGYLAAYELVAGPWTARKGLAALLPSAALGAGYAVLYRALGYGVRGSGLYLDPFSSLGAFVTTLPERLLAMSAGQLVAVPADLRPRVVPVVCGALAVALGGLMLCRAWGGLTGAQRRGARWLLAGAGLSLLPVAATEPMNRLLLLPSLGGAVLVAILVRYGWTATGRLERAAAYGLLVVHVPLSAIGWITHHHGLATAGPRAEEVLLTRHLEVASRRVVLIAAPDFATAVYAQSVRAYRGVPQPRAWWTLSAAPYDHRLTRTGMDSFELEVVGGRMLSTAYERVFRGSDPALRAGARVALDGATATVLDADEVGPKRVAFHFAVPLEDPSLLILEWRDGKLQPMALPAVGASRYLPYTPGPLSPLGF